MSLFVTSLNSGSNGNCYYVANENEAVLVDVGISCKEIELRIKRLGLSIEKIKAIFISHEHTDHVNGLRSFLKKYPLPVYITQNTLSQGIHISRHLVQSFSAHESVKIGELVITAFPKKHDAVDPFSFIITNKNVTVGVFTDIGVACSNVIHYFKQCHAVFLESNYDAAMLHNGNYPFILKRRISGGNGHLSNAEALDVFLKHKSDFLSHLFLSHLSQNNNRVEIVETLFNQYANGVKIIVASRFKEIPVYKIESNNHDQARKHYVQRTVTQLAFAFN